MNAEPKLPFERWSRLAAQSTFLEPEGFYDLLEREGVDPEDYDEAEQVHLVAIGEGARRGDRSLAEAHAASCSVARRDAGEQAPVSLPFGRAPAAPALPAHAWAPADQSGETLMGASESADNTLPFQQSSSLPTVAQYARLRAELDFSPQAAASVRARHGFADDQRFDALTRLFTVRLAADARARVEYEHVYRGMLEMLSEATSPGEPPR